MAYKKYITRGGKVYGPYIYHSKRVDGKVVSEYHGAHTKKIDYKKFLWVGLGILIIAILVFGIYSLGKTISGQATFDVKVDYKEGEALDGVLKLSLKEGESFPTSSKLVFENNGDRYEYVLADVISDKTVEGNFYVEGKQVTGSGIGYGLEGVKEIYPIVYFTLEVYSDQETTALPSVPQEGASTSSRPQDTELGGKEVEEEVAPLGVPSDPELEGKETEPGITGGAVSFFFGWMATGRVTMELQTEIIGQVSRDNAFIHDLSEGETVEIKSKSVRTSSEDLSDNVLEINMEGNELTVTTDYSEEEKGFGEDYLGEDTITLNIDLSDLNLILNTGDLKISLIYSEEELISLTTVLQEGETAEVKIEEALPSVPSSTELEGKEIPEPEVIVPSGIDLTDEERNILINEFGAINIETIREEIKGDRLIIGFQIRDYKIEHTYDYPQAEEILQSQIRADLTKWLKDIAATLSRKASSSQQIDIIEDSYVL